MPAGFTKSRGPTTCRHISSPCSTGSRCTCRSRAAGWRPAPGKVFTSPSIGRSHTGARWCCSSSGLAQRRERGQHSSNWRNFFNGSSGMVQKQMARSLVQALVLLSGLGLVLLASPVLAEEPKLEVESYLIPSADPGIQLYIRNKHAAGVTSFPAERILLYVHGATYPAETAFDLPLNGLSMMDYVAQQGFDVYLVDVRGYGGSTRPPEMDKPAAENGPIVDTPVAVRDVGTAVSHILQKRGVAKINLMGWSWGTAIMGMYTTGHNERVNRLVLYAPLWLFSTRPLIGGSGPLGAYRTVTKDEAKQRWLSGVPENKKAELIPSGW